MLNETLKGSCFFQMHPLLKVKPMNYFFNYPMDSIHYIELCLQKSPARRFGETDGLNSHCGDFKDDFNLAQFSLWYKN